MESSAAKAKPQGRLLVSTPLDAKDELEEVCKGQQQHEDVCLGLFCLVLTEPNQAQRSYRDLTLLSRDGMNGVLVKINQILMGEVPQTARRLEDTGGDLSSKNLWLAESVLDILLDQKSVKVSSSMSVKASSSRSVKVSSSRSVKVSSSMSVKASSSRSVKVSSSSLAYVSCREWVGKSAMLVAMAVYTYLRLMVDHGTSPLLQLRQKEVDFCISMLRER
ncbi:hypothetical protein CRUP_025299, partial [Coryphaenoides rupestris]